VSKNVVASDTDPESNYPLSLVGVSYTGPLGTASIASSTNILFEATDATGSAVVGYTVQDSLGASASGTLTVTITSGLCQ
jgi:hypothetical protein